MSHVNKENEMARRVVTSLLTGRMTHQMWHNMRGLDSNLGLLQASCPSVSTLCPICSPWRMRDSLVMPRPDTQGQPVH
jgi:hypothetical protein